MNLLLKNFIARYAAYAGTFVLTYLTSLHLGPFSLDPETAGQIALALTGLIVAFGEGLTKMVWQFAFQSLSPENQTFMQEQMRKAEVRFGSGTGAQKKTFVVEAFVQLYQRTGFDVPKVPAAMEIWFVRRAAGLIIDKLMPWLNALAK